jgi:hypothetical protein
MFGDNILNSSCFGHCSLANGVQRSFVELQWTHLELFKSFKMNIIEL